jgi:hypothetical protein
MKERALRQYIREAILAEKSTKSVFSGISLNPKEWFADFMSRQLDKIGEKVAGAISDKLDAILPDEFKQEIESRGKSTSDVGKMITKAVDEWIEYAEDHRDMQFSSAEKKKLYGVAVQSFNKNAKKSKDMKSALYAVTKDLDAYASKSKNS